MIAYSSKFGAAWTRHDLPHDVDVAVPEEVVLSIFDTVVVACRVDLHFSNVVMLCCGCISRRHHSRCASWNGVIFSYSWGTLSSGAVRAYIGIDLSFLIYHRCLLTELSRHVSAPGVATPAIFKFLSGMSLEASIFSMARGTSVSVPTLANTRLLFPTVMQSVKQSSSLFFLIEIFIGTALRVVLIWLLKLPRESELLI